MGKKTTTFFHQLWRLQLATLNLGVDPKKPPNYERFDILIHETSLSLPKYCQICRQLLCELAARKSEKVLL